MSITYYKPNSSGKGALLSVNFTARTDKIVDGKVTEKGDKSFYFKVVGQTSWDANEKTGGFKDGKQIVVKLSPTEIGGILTAIQKNTTLAAAMNQEYVYHDGSTHATTIYFQPAFKKVQVDGKWVDSDKQTGFGFRVTKTEKANKENKETLGVGLTFAECRLLEEFLIDGLSHYFNAVYSEDIGRNSKPKKAAATKTESKTEPIKEKAPEPAEEPPSDIEF